MVGVGALRWAVALADLDPIHRSEQAGRRRVLVVSYEPFHASGLVTVCPISARRPRYPNEVLIPDGHAGQTKAGVILVHQVRTISQGRIFSWEVLAGEGVQYITDPSIRREVRDGLRTHLGLDLPETDDGAS